MKIHLLSDTHWEMASQSCIERWLCYNGPHKDTVAVIAGDFTSITFLPSDLLALSKNYQHVVYVPGNHEYWGSPVSYVEAILDMIKFHNVTILRNTSVEIDGIKFYGGTGWFPLIPSANYLKTYMNDFAEIRGFVPWVYEQNRRFINGALKSKADVIVSHHIPTFQEVHPKFQRHPLNPFFVTEGDEIFLASKPKIWLYGHTHENNKTLHNNCVAVCHPCGYPSETSHLYKPLELQI